MSTVDPKLLAKAKHLWSQFDEEARDMPFSEFLAEIAAMTNPQKMQDDLMGIQLMKARQDSAKLRIDRAINEN